MNETKEEYEVRYNTNDGRVHTNKSENPKEVGQVYRDVKKALKQGESVEINKRTITTSPWQNVEKESR